MKTPVRVALVSLQAYGLFHHDWKKPFGGGEMQAVELVRALARFGGMESTVLTIGTEPAGVEEHGLLKVVRIPERRGLLKPVIAYDLREALYKADPRVVVQMGYGYETGIAAWYCGSQCAAFVHLLASDKDVGLEGGWRASWPMRTAYRYGVHRAARIYAQHGGQQQALREQFGLESSILRPLHEVPPLPEHAGHELLWVGRCVGLKQPMVFLDLVERLPDHPARMVCQPHIDRPLFEAVSKRAASLSNCTFHPGLSPEETEALFCQARVLAITSTFEGFPNVLIEACKFGVPVVSLNINPDSVVTVHELGGLARGDFDRLVEITKNLLEDDTLHDTCRRNAYRYAAENHKVERLIPLISTEFRRLAGEV